MTCRRPVQAIAVATAAVCLSAAAWAAPARTTVSPRTKHRAERDVLRVVPRYVHRSGVVKLIDPNSGLLKDNVQISCSGRGKRYSGGRRASFVCSIRPAPRQRIVVRVMYRGTKAGKFHLRWLRVPRA